MTTPKRKSRKGTRQGIPRPPKTEVEPVLALLQQKKTPREIAAILNKARSTIYRTIRRAGIQLDPTPDRVDADETKVAAAYKSGKSVRRIGKEMQVSENVVERRLERAGVRLRQRELQIKIAELVSLYQGGTSCQALARKCQCSWDAIQRRLQNAGVKLRTRKQARAKKPGEFSWDRNKRHVRVKNAAGAWIRVAQLLWEKAHGAVAEGCVLIRIDKELPPNKIDRVENLATIDRKALPGRRWAKRLVDIDREPATRHQILCCILLIAVLNAKTTRLQFGGTTNGSDSG